MNVLGILEIEGLRKINKDTLGCSVVQQYVHQSKQLFMNKTIEYKAV